MNDKYYTPSIEDIRVGYECELHVAIRKDDGMWTDKEWVKGKVTNLYSFEWTDYRPVPHRFGFNYEPRFRTPYLTKEQIESEGWKIIEFKYPSKYSKFAFEKGNYAAVLLNDGRIAMIMKDVLLDDYTCNTSNGQLYLGQCPSINEFRQITKLICQKQEPELTEKSNLPNQQPKTG